jgi:hypothetical protein
MTTPEKFVEPGARSPGSTEARRGPASGLAAGAEKTAHTPGPWSVGDPRQGESDLMVYCNDATGQRIADCTNEYTWHGGAEKRANARLIAAAPDLLAVLETIADIGEGSTTANSLPNIALLARAAIKFATVAA